MKVLFCASEVVPFAATGGLGEVAASLPLALGRLGVEVRIVMPKYRGIRPFSKRLSEKVTIHFVENKPYFNRPSLYGGAHGDYPDNLERFSFFCRAALERARGFGFKPQIVHAHDWQTALLAVLLKTRAAQDEFFRDTRCVLTVHNLAYQGIFPHRLYPALGLGEELYSPQGFEFHGRINLLKAGILFADGVNTVSPTYAAQIATPEYGFGLDEVAQKAPGGVLGILNGVDSSVWDPQKDRWIKRSYSADDPAGKIECKIDLQKRCRLEADPEIPLFGVVSRLAEQKGMDLLAKSMDRFLSRRVQLVMLGQGDSVYHTTFTQLGRRHRRQAAIFVGFDVKMAHRIYAGCDFFLMPSSFEPCGLGQLIALRYGTLPIVRKTGGLADTITDLTQDPQHGNGFAFSSKEAAEFLQAIERALSLFIQPQRMATVRERVMKADFSWEKSAREYLKFYRSVLEAK